MTLDKYTNGTNTPQRPNFPKKMLRYTRIFENLSESTNIQSKDFTQEKFIQLMAKHKGLLIRLSENENPLTVNDFGRFIASFDLENYPYIGGAAPRRIVPCDAGKDLIYTANEAPPDTLIPFHHELAQTQNPPKFLFFFCDQPADSGGETALVDSTLIFRYVNDRYPFFMKKLKKFGARYTRVMPPVDDPKSPQGRSFYNTYQVKTKEEVEEILRATKGADYKWLPNGDLSVTSEPVPAVKFIKYQHTHAIYQWTFHNSIIAAFIGWQDSRNNRFKAVRFGNDDTMEPDILQDIADFMDKKKISYPWQKGDIFALNNQLVMHSRNSFTGMRKVYASMFGDAKCSTKIPKKIPNLLVSDPLTFGFWRLENPEETAYQAIKAGYRRLDSACDYGNEKETGRGIRRAISEGLVKREDLFITTKLWNTYHNPEHVPIALDKCLCDLGLDYVDEFLIHFPISMEFVPFETKYPPEWSNTEGKMIVIPNDINATWRAMEALVDAGKTRRIGLSNFNCQHIRQVKSIARIQPTSLQIECHPHLSQEKLLRFAREEGIRVTVFSPLGSTSYISLNMATKDDSLLYNSVILDLAKKHGKTPAQILYRWALQRETLPIGKTGNVERMKENRNLFDFYLHKEDLDAMKKLDINRRYNDPGVFCEAAFGTFCPIYE